MSIVQEGGPALDPGLLRWGGYGLALASATLGIVGLFARSPLLAATNIALAIASVAVTLPAPELFEVTSRGRSRGLNPVFMVPAALVFIAGIENDFVDIAPLLIAAAAGALVFAGAGLPTWRRPGVAGPWQFVIVLALTGAALGYGAPALVDTRFDASPPQPFRVAISAMYVSHGKSTSYSLRLAPWGPRTQGSTESVAASLYNRLKPGDEVCVGLRRGALGVPWFVVHLCPATA
jgi:hypothetical protein